MKQTHNEYRIVSVLHDTVEHTSITLNDLREKGFSEEIMEAIDCLTKRENETDMNFIRRCKQNKIALLVKLADIDDNSDSLRANNPSEKEYERLKKYSKEKDELLS